MTLGRTGNRHLSNRLATRRTSDRSTGRTDGPAPTGSARCLSTADPDLTRAIRNCPVYQNSGELESWSLRLLFPDRLIRMSRLPPVDTALIVNKFKWLRCFGPVLSGFRNDVATNR